MKASEIIMEARVEVDDVGSPYFIDDPVMLRWLQQADEEAARRTLMLREALNNEVCLYPVAINQRAVELHASVLRIDRAQMEYVDEEGNLRVQELTLRTARQMDQRRPGWRTDRGEPMFLVTDLQRGYAILTPYLSSDNTKGKLRIECSRMPIKKLTMDECPETSSRYHRDLAHWLVHRYFANKDKDVHDKGKSDAAETRFGAVFGPPASAIVETEWEQLPDLNVSHVRHF